MVRNSIIWGNSAWMDPQIEIVGRVPDGYVVYCNIQDDQPMDEAFYEIITSDPLFADAESGDFHLSGTSPCIDAGDPSFVAHMQDRDVDGQWRIWDGDDDGLWRVDIGADEYGSHYPGDIDGNNAVGLADLQFLLTNYDQILDMTPADGDLDLDGDVDADDLATLLAVYGTSWE